MNRRAFIGITMAAAAGTALAPASMLERPVWGESILAKITPVATTGNHGLTSIWFATWAEDQVHLIYPKGSRAGLDDE